MPSSDCMVATCDGICGEAPAVEGTACATGVCSAAGVCRCTTNDDCAAACGSDCLCVNQTSCIESPAAWALAIEPEDPDAKAQLESMALQSDGDLVFSVHHGTGFDAGGTPIAHAGGNREQTSAVSFTAGGDYGWHGLVHPTLPYAQIGTLGNGAVFMAGLFNGDSSTVNACVATNCALLTTANQQGFVAWFDEVGGAAITAIATNTSAAGIDVDAVACAGNCVVVGTYSASFELMQPGSLVPFSVAPAPQTGSRGAFVIAYRNDLTIDWIRFVSSNGGFALGNGPHATTSVAINESDVFVGFDFDNTLQVQQCANAGCANDDYGPELSAGGGKSYGVVRFSLADGDALSATSAAPGTAGRKPMAATSSRVALAPAGPDVEFGGAAGGGIDDDCIVGSLTPALENPAGNRIGGQGDQRCYGQASDGTSLLTAFFSNGATAEIALGSAGVAAEEAGAVGLVAWSGDLSALLWSTSFGFTNVDATADLVAARNGSPELGSAFGFIGQATDAGGGTVDFSNTVSAMLACTTSDCASAIVRLDPVTETDP